MIDRMYEFSDPRKIVAASKAQLRQKCRALTEAELKYDSFLVFPEDELKMSSLHWSDLPSWWHLVHLYLRMFAWAKSEIRCRVGAGEMEEFWKFMDLKDARENNQESREKMLSAVIEAGLWERDGEGDLWCYDLCRDYLSRSWLTATEIIDSLSEVVNESKGEPLDLEVDDTPE